MVYLLLVFRFCLHRFKKDLTGLLD